MYVWATGPTLVPIMYTKLAGTAVPSSAAESSTSSASLGFRMASQCGHRAWAAFFLGLGLAIFGYLSYMLHAYPLLRFAVHDLDWTREWLYMTVLDYYGVAFCLCAIAMASERLLIVGVLWSLGFCLLGSTS